MATPFVLDTPDLDKARELIGGLIAPFGLTPCRKGGYRARVRAGRLGALGIAEVSYRGAVDIQSDAPAGAQILEIPEAGYCRARRATGSWDAGPGAIVASPPGRPVRTWMSDGSRLLVIRVPEDAVVPVANGAERPDLFPPRRGWRPARRLAPPRLASVRRLARLVFEAQDGTDTVSADPGLALELQRVLLMLLSADPSEQAPDALPGPPPGPPPGSLLGGPLDAQADMPSMGPLPGSVRRAQALMIAAPDGGLPLGLVAAQCGVGVRTLQENFRAFTGQTPTEWWRGYRLDRVDAALRAGRPGTSVTDCALAYGFNHLGRFAEQYRARFGRSPSETLRLAEGRPPAVS